MVVKIFKHCSSQNPLENLILTVLLVQLKPYPTHLKRKKTKKMLMKQVASKQIAKKMPRVVQADPP